MRTQVLTSLDVTVTGLWQDMHTAIMEHRRWWDTFGQPMRPALEAQALGGLWYPRIINNDNVIGCVTATYLPGHCLELSALQKNPALGLLMHIQNCTHRYFQVCFAECN